MAKVSPLQSDFSGGEVSPLFQGRVDSELYRKCLAQCFNYIPTIQGGATRRPGDRFAAEIKDSSARGRLVPFRFSTEQAYMLEFTNNAIRVYRDEGQVLEAAKTITGISQANPAVVTIASHGYSSGDEVYLSTIVGMTELNGRNLKATVLTGNTFSLQYLDGTNVNSTSFTAYSSAGTSERVYTLASNYGTADLFGLRFTQSADTLYIAHPGYAPRALTRTGHAAWTITTLQFDDGPYLSANTTTTTLTPSAATGSGITLTASATTGINGGAGFASTDVGRTIRMKQASTWGWARITGWTSTTVVTVAIESTLTTTDPKTIWRMGVWSTTTGFPAAVVFHEDRLTFAGCPEVPERVDFSKSGDYLNFEPSAMDGTVASDNAISAVLNANEVNASRWLSSDEKGLLTGTSGAEWVIRPSSQGEALSPTNIAAKKATSFGGADCNILQIGKSTIFIQRSGRKMREFVYFYDVDGFQSNDLTFIAEHMLQEGVTELAYQAEPQPTVWCVREDGGLSAMTYARDPDSLKVGWSEHQIGGYADAANNPAVVESVAVIPSADESFDQLWMIVRRRVNGRTVRYVEFMDRIFNDTVDQQDACFLDSALTYDVPITVTGATKANPVVITAGSHGLNNGDSIVLSEIEGMTELNGNIYTVANKTANTFELSGVNGTGFTTYVSGGEVRKRVSTVSGLWHLEGQTVQVYGDGAVQPTKTVSNGAITLSTPAAVVQVGLGYVSDLKMLRLEAGATDGTSLAKTRRTHQMGMLLHRTLGMKIGTSFDDLTTITFRTTSDEMGHAPALFSGIINESLGADYDTENQICIRQDQPTPGTILAIAPRMVTQDRG